MRLRCFALGLSAIVLASGDAVAQLSPDAQAANEKALEESFRALGISDADFATADSLLRAIVRQDASFLKAVDQLDRAIKTSKNYQRTDASQKVFDDLKPWIEVLRSDGLEPIDRFLKFYRKYKKGDYESSYWRDMFEHLCDPMDWSASAFQAASAIGVSVSILDSKTVDTLNNGNTGMELCESLLGKSVTDTNKSVLESLRKLKKTHGIFVGKLRNTFDSLAIYAGQPRYIWSQD